MTSLCHYMSKTLWIFARYAVKRTRFHGIWQPGCGFVLDSPVIKTSTLSVFMARLRRKSTGANILLNKYSSDRWSEPPWHSCNITHPLYLYLSHGTTLFSEPTHAKKNINELDIYLVKFATILYYFLAQRPTLMIAECDYVLAVPAYRPWVWAYPTGMNMWFVSRWPGHFHSSLESHLNHT